jgi:hypothetical protein
MTSDSDRCQCVASHSPVAPYVDRHHILPRGWGGPTESGNLIAICQNCHRTVHEILEEAVRRQHWPDHDFLAHLSPYAIGLARQAIVAYGSIPPRRMLGLAYRFEPSPPRGQEGC